MEKKTLTDVKFPVALEPIYVESPVGSMKNDLLESQDFKLVPDFRAVVAKDDGQVFSVVGKNYHLVTNEDALNLAGDCFSAIFDTIGIDEMELFNIIMPKTRSFCHVDFIHRDSEIELFSDDKWVPYIRVTNSYNRMFALKFDLGFCRWICKNGIIAGKSNIEFKFLHTRGSKQPKAEFKLRRGEFQSLEIQFKESLINLNRFHVPPKLMWPLTCKVFAISIPKKPTEKQAEHLKRVKEHIDTLSNRYFDELGHTAYAAMNVLSDYASRPTVSISPDASINGLQRKTGNWIDSFSSEIEKRGFDFNKYLGTYAELVA